MRFQVAKPVLAGREREYVMDALASGWVSGAGPYVERFESEVSRFLGRSDGVAVVNGTAALHLALLAVGLTPTTEVVVPALTFVATANAVTYCGARPVFAECDPETWNVTRQSVEAALTPRCGGVVLVHLFGLPAPVVEISELCRERGLWLVEDCAQSFGARVGDRFVGSYGAAAAFSFYGNKVISTGEGGMVFAGDGTQRCLLRRLRNQGTDTARRHWYSITGFNYRMTNVAAAMGCGQIEMIDYHLAERRRIATRYRENFMPLQRRGLVRLPVEPPGYLNVFWLSTLVLEKGTVTNRERIRSIALDGHGIETRPFFIPMHRLPIHARLASFPNAEFLGDHGIILPTYAGLSDPEIDEICQVFSDLILRELT